VPIRIALGEDSPIVREALQQLLGVDPEVEVVAAVADRCALRQACDEMHPDVVLTDIRMPPTHTDEGIQLAAELRSSHPQVGVVVLSQFLEPGFALALLEHGAAGRAYLLKEGAHNRAKLMTAVRTVVEGGSMIDAKVVDALVGACSRAARPWLGDLTARELQVLTEIARGRSDTAIAESLSLTQRAVEMHISAIFGRLGLAGSSDVSNRVKAALTFLAEEATSPVR
jgi:DNA-binding NarL/FixJ family response regulator